MMFLPLLIFLLPKEEPIRFDSKPPLFQLHVSDFPVKQLHRSQSSLETAQNLASHAGAYLHA